MTTIPEKPKHARGPVLLLFLLSVALLPTTLHAKELTVDEVRAAVETWVRHVTADARPDAVVERMEPYIVDGKTMAYIAHLAGGGICLCGADDLVLPVYLYSPHGTFDANNPGLSFVLREVKARTDALRAAVARRDPWLQKHGAALAERAGFWQDLVARRILPARGGSESRGTPTLMELPLTCTWGQGSPYNDDCPELTPNADEHALVGCTATAAAQIMYYWQWPPSGEDSDPAPHVDYWIRWRTGSWLEEPLADDPNIPFSALWVGRLHWTSESGGKLRMYGYWDDSVYGAAEKISEDGAYQSALSDLWSRMDTYGQTFYAHPGVADYDWSLLQNVHDDPPDAGDDEVAELCYDIAVCAHMDFGLLRSGAWVDDMAYAFEDHFRYDTDATYGALSESTMINEVQWLRPVEMCGWDDHGAHAWVVYGYNTDPESTQFKMNMGWSGHHDDWYSCDAILDDPNDPNDLPQYNQNQAHAYRLAPESVVRFVGAADAGDGSPNNPYEDIEEAIAEAPDGTTLILKAGSVNTFSSPTLVIDRPLTLKGYNVTIE